MGGAARLPSCGVPGGSGREHWTLAFSDEPEGVISTRTAGAVEFRATLTWRRADEATPGPVLAALPPAPRGTGAVRSRVEETPDPSGATRRVLCEVRALTERDLGFALDAALRAANNVAALTGAVLEARAVRVAPPRATPASVLEKLARDLWGAGFRVRFGTSWSPTPEADVCLGIRGAGGALLAFLDAHPSWEVLPRSR